MKPHPTLAVKPPELQGLLFDFWWELEKLHSLELPTRMVDMDELSWHLDLPYWKHNDKPFKITPRQVMNDPDKYPYHFERTLNADLQYPIIVRQNDERVLMVDGVHRLLKAVMESRQEIMSSFFDDSHIPLILHD